jgi:hypothetical protein
MPFVVPRQERDTSDAIGRWRLAARVVTFLLNAAAGALAIYSLTTRWKRQGNGSSFTAIELGRTLTSGPTALSSGRYVMAGIYVVGLSGCVLLALAGSTRRRSSAARLVVTIVLLVVLWIAVTRAPLPVAQWAAGPRLLLTAVALSALSLIIGQLTPSLRRPKESP